MLIVVLCFCGLVSVVVFVVKVILAPESIIALLALVRLLAKM